MAKRSPAWSWRDVAGLATAPARPVHVTISLPLPVAEGLDRYVDPEKAPSRAAAAAALIAAVIADDAAAEAAAREGASC